MIWPGISPGAGVGIATSEASILDAQPLSDKAASIVRAARAARVAWLIRTVMTHWDSSAGQPNPAPPGPPKTERRNGTPKTESRNGTPKQPAKQATNQTGKSGPARHQNGEISGPLPQSKQSKYVAVALITPAVQNAS